MARNQKHYDADYKVESVNLAKEIGLTGIYYLPKKSMFRFGSMISPDEVIRKNIW